VVGVATKTLLRWMKVPEFQTAYRESRRTAYFQAVAKLQQGATAAAATLLKVMLDPDARVEFLPPLKRQPLILCLPESVFHNIVTE
jgi:hypothetical protein